MRPEEARRILFSKFNSPEEAVEWLFTKLQRICLPTRVLTPDWFMTGEDALTLKALIVLTGIGGSEIIDPWTALYNICEELDREYTTVVAPEGKIKTIRNRHYSYFKTKLRLYILGTLRKQHEEYLREKPK